MKTSLKFLFVFIFLLSMNHLHAGYSSDTMNYNPDRIFHAMLKAEQGDTVTIGVIGGSITQGYAASSESTRWANLVAQWWQNTFENAHIKFINAGIGGTGSNIGAFRINDDLLRYDPDFIIIEFAVNDSLNDKTTEFMEGMVRQALNHPSKPGIMILTLKDEKGTTALDYHKPVAGYYHIPLVNFAGLIDERVRHDGVPLHDIFIDGLHPVDIGMKYITEMITDELEKIYQKLPDPENMPETVETLPSPLRSDNYEKTKQLTNKDISPVSNHGWSTDQTGWIAEEPGSEICFRINGRTVALLYTKHNQPGRGKAEVWIDNEKPVLLDSNWDQTWGPAILFSLIGENMDGKEHVIHIRMTEGKYFQVLNLLSAE